MAALVLASALTAEARSEDSASEGPETVTVEPAVRAVVDFSGAADSWSGSPPLRARLLAAVARMRAPVLFLHTANDYSTAPGQALADEMRRLGKPHRLRIYPAVGRTPREGHNFVFSSVPLWEADVFAFLDEILK